jgi:hypothetical protein
MAFSLSRRIASIRHGRARPGHPRLGVVKKDVDARHKAGHDDKRAPDQLNEASP